MNIFLKCPFQWYAVLVIVSSSQVVDHKFKYPVNEKQHPLIYYFTLLIPIHKAMSRGTIPSAVVSYTAVFKRLAPTLGPENDCPQGGKLHSISPYSSPFTLERASLFCHLLSMLRSPCAAAVSVMLNQSLYWKRLEKNLGVSNRACRRRFNGSKRTVLPRCFVSYRLRAPSLSYKRGREKELVWPIKAS